MQRIKYSFLILILLGVGFSSCDRNDGDAEKNEETFLQEFTFDSRATPPSGLPDHADTYTIMAYKKGGTGSTTVDREEIRNDYQFGYYAYDLVGDYEVDAIIPVTVNPITYLTTLVSGKLDRDQSQGLYLPGIPSGTNDANTGYYYASMIHPAIPVHSTTNLGYLAVFERDDEIWASFPKDKDGDGVTTDPFELEVYTNRQVHDASGVHMYPVTAAIKVYLYSHFYVNGSQKNIDFTVESIQLVNAGSNGWFNPMTGEVYPNYNYTNYYRNTYNSSLLTDGSRSNAEDLLPDLEDDPAGYTITTVDNEQVQAKYMVDKVPVFPADYRGSEGGGSTYIIPMTLSLQLKETSSGLLNNVAVPISLRILRNKCYTFYVNLKSEQIEIAYSVSSWEREPQEDEYNDIGEEVIDYLTIPINWGPGDWSNGNPTDPGTEIGS